MKNCACFLLLFGCFPTVTACAEASSTDKLEVLLLTNGQVLKGLVSELGDRYKVTLVSGVETRIPRKEVELRCNSIEELYSWKSQLNKRGDIREHLDLAEWCLREKLYPQTALQLLAAMSLDPDNPRIEQIQRRLSFRLEATPAKRKRTSTAPPPASFQQIEEVVKKTPPKAIQQFTSTIQPLLFNRCASGGCHGANTKSDFRLFRPAGGRSVSRRLTQRNLHAVLGFVDRKKPQDSKLLADLRSSHGVEQKPVFKNNERHYFDLLSNWIVQSTLHPGAAAPATIKEPTSNLSQTTSFYRENHRSEFPPKDPPQKAQSKDSQEDKNSLLKKKAKSSSNEYRPRDPFDVEIFNRRFHSGQQ